MGKNSGNGNGACRSLGALVPMETALIHSTNVNSPTYIHVNGNHIMQERGVNPSAIDNDSLSHILKTEFFFLGCLAVQG